MVKIRLIILFLLPLSLFAQTYADWWYFGFQAGIHFTPSGAVANNEGQLTSTEGCASIADDFGNLLFYTRGDTVWDSTHNVMQNGTGLLGNGIAGDGAMSAFIVPRPEHPAEYYIFTVRSLFGGMWYSKVDMTLNGGLGGVVPTEKNIPLVESTTEMVTGIRKPNNRDFWVITMGKPGDTAYAFEVTPSGVNTTPVLSNTGLLLQNTDDVGYLRGSQQSDRLAMTLVKLESTQVNANGIHLFDVNNLTGEVSYDLTIIPSVADTMNYGIEFSPNGNYLYVQSMFNSDCRQYDLSSGVAATINASEELLGPGYLISGGGALQLGPDGKLYVARNTQFLIATVEFPNNGGAFAGYNHDALSLGGPVGSFGLPQFLPFILEGNVIVDDACFGDSITFSSNYLNADSVKWNFGDPGAAGQDTSSSFNPTYAYTDTGTFTVTHIAYDAFLADTTLLTVRVLPRQSLNLPLDTLFCNGLPATLDLEQAGVLHYLWNGDTGTSTFTIVDTGLLSVGIVGVCDTFNQNMFVAEFTPSTIALGPDTTLCDQLNFVIGDTGISPNYFLVWNTGDLTSTINIDSSATYVLAAFNTCDTLVDSIRVVFTNSINDSLLPKDTVLCFDTVLSVSRPQEAGVVYTWNNGTSDEFILVDTTETLILTASNACNTVFDTLRVVFNGEIITELGPDTSICEKDTILLRGLDSTATYFWSNGAQTDSIWTTLGSTERYRVTITKGDCVKEDAIFVTSDFLSCPNINCAVNYGNVFTPNGDGMNDRFIAWSDCDIFKFDMTIYNRWGQLVHYSDNISFGWDGFINGEPAAPGSYYFVIEYKDLVVVDADRQLTRGSFVLIR
jgi:gliding motility-associated-like protein